MSPEEAFAELEKKVERLESALETLLESILMSPNVEVDTAVAAGRASNVLRGIEE